ncbi:MAG: ABC transporter ATP-binding protein [Rhodospirillales bacterium SCN 65-16]|jgi:branched-chain amino acid transport system ATP-binding protein|uniref:ABC transporter ATP-binding protein n=1 Tax=Bosea sp. (in: a-proteobacteria) TaxID=1871050 RepID=UPI0008698A28|nr:ABC transporter ATP-binding protein [Bosea sp. (in: a-proteobacteria)]MBN9469360.1 ABC transporter ATP-binding protein [Bosea sp. (in: a-proteobacteria)]ODT99131.1 MAG: ABC transporter ATP-binding protein [Rhodospirillales bacterium SCN 65-16]
MLAVRGLTKSFGGFAAVSNVSFDVREGEIMGLIGPNGSGKSTTFSCIAGFYTPTAGSVTFDGRDITGLGAQSICHAGIGRTFQIPRPFAKLTVLENVALAAWFGQDRKTSRDKCWRQAAEALELVGLPTDPHSTTEGMGAAALKKLELARAIASQPRLLLADESLNGLDPSEMNQAAAMLDTIRKERGITIIWVEHIMGVLMRVVDRVVVLDHGEVIYDGDPAGSQADPNVIAVYLGREAAKEAAQ